jgi:hypothetical protein
MSTIDEQAAAHAEAWRRSNPNNELQGGTPPEGYISANAGLQAGDMWSSGGEMPGVMTPDLQGPTPPLAPGVTPVAEDFGEGNFNVEEIVRNPHGWRR